MKKITGLNAVPEVQYQPLVIDVYTGETGRDLVLDYSELAAKQEIVEHVLAQLREMEVRSSEAELRITHIRDSEIAPALEAAKALLESDGYVEFRVRPLMPLEQLQLIELTTIPAPVPPIKDREIAPLSVSGRMQPDQVTDQKYVDVNDPGYQAALRAWEKEDGLKERRSMVYTIATCVEGFDLTDEEIKGALGEDAAPREPIESLRKRMDQLARIILTKLEFKFVGAITSYVREMSGVRQDRVNFTSRSSFPLS